MNDTARPPLVLVATRHARNEETSRFLRFVREHSSVLKQYSLHCTAGTAAYMKSTGLYGSDDISLLLPGSSGGMVQVAAMVALHKCVALVLLSDPRDRFNQDVVTRVVKRIAGQRGIRLVTTYPDAVRWAQFEAVPPPPVPRGEENWRLRDWEAGLSDLSGSRQIDQRTVAITAQDGSKSQMIQFVTPNISLLARHRAILATGITGWILKLLYADPEQEESALREIGRFAHEAWVSHLIELTAQLRPDTSVPSAPLDLEPVAPMEGGSIDDLRRNLGVMRELFGTAENPDFSEKVKPLTPGSAGGNAWLAGEVLKNRCDVVLCFHDPLGPLPQVDDVSLFEQTCQIPGVLAACIVNPPTSSGWIAGLENEVAHGPGLPLLAESLRAKFRLKEVVVVEAPHNVDSDELGGLLCHAAAGYLHTAIQRIRTEGGGRVAVSWGWGVREILRQFHQMQSDGTLVSDRRMSGESIVWSTAVGRFETDDESLTADSLAQNFSLEFGDGPKNVDAFGSSAYVPDLRGLSESDSALATSLRYAKLALVSAAPWDSGSGLYARTNLIRENSRLFPLIDDPSVAGTFNCIFLSLDGKEVTTQLKLVGLGFDSMRTLEETERAVLLVCGGNGRHLVLRSALWARLVSVLITSRGTAEWLLDQPSSAPVGEALHGTYARVPAQVTDVHQDHVSLIVPSWSFTEPISVATSQLPQPVLQAVNDGKRKPLDLLAIANLGAETAGDLNLQDIELAPILESSTGL